MSSSGLEKNSVEADPKDSSAGVNWISALRGVWSLTWKSRFSMKRLPMLAASVALIPLLAYLTIDDGLVRPYFRWVIDFYFMLVLPLYCLSVCGAMIRDEVQANTLGFLITRPVTRAQLFSLKYAAHLIWLQVLGLAGGFAFILVGMVREIPGIASFGAVFLGVQSLAIVSYAALSALLGLIHQRYMVLGLLYGFIVEVGIGHIPTNINNLSLSRHIRTLLANSDRVQELYEWSPEKTGWSILIMAGAALVFFIIGAALFSVREFHHNEEMQK